MVNKCRVCDFDKHIEYAEFCQKCGCSLTNYCTNDMCDMNNGDPIPVPYDADYCPYCGSLTTLSDVEDDE